MQEPLIIDAHVHMGPGLANWTDRPFVSAETGDQVVAVLDAAGIDRACVFAPSWEGGDFDDHDYRLANLAIAEAVQKYPDRLIGICRVNPNLAARAVDEMRRCHDEYGFLGLKLHPDWEFFSINSPMMRPFLDMAQSFKWPVLLHSGYYPLSQPALVLPIAQQYPGLDFVLFHLGYRFVTDAMLIAERCPNVFLETSANASPVAIAEVVYRLGPGKLIYGSDTPATKPSEVIAKIRMQPRLSESDMRQILGGNLLNLITKSGAGLRPAPGKNAEESVDV